MTWAMSLAKASDGARRASSKRLAWAHPRVRPRQRSPSRKQHGCRNLSKSAAGLALPSAHPLSTHRRSARRRARNDPEPTPGASIADASWSAFRRMRGYKTARYGSDPTVGPRFYPSTKTCVACGYVKPDIRLDERVVQCEAGGGQMDRDLNAARNLAPLFAGSSPGTHNTCGGEDAGRRTAG